MTRSKLPPESNHKLVLAALRDAYARRPGFTAKKLPVETHRESPNTIEFKIVGNQIAASDGWAFLHAGGALGEHGPLADIELALPPALAKMQLPTPPADPCSAIRASLKLLDLGPDRLTVPAYGAIWRAPQRKSGNSARAGTPISAGYREVRS